MVLRNLMGECFRFVICLVVVYDDDKNVVQDGTLLAGKRFTQWVVIIGLDAFIASDLLLENCGFPMLI